MSGPLGPLLLSDSTMPVHFCKAGLPAANAMATFLGDAVYMVDEVHDELMRLAEVGLVPLQTLLKTWPQNEIIAVGAELRESVADADKIRQMTGQHVKEDRGEVATVLWAEQHREATGQRFVILTDDGWGNQLARDRRLQCVKTPALVVQMVKHDAFSFRDGKRVYQACFTNPDHWKRYPVDIKRECPEKLPPPAQKKTGKGEKRKK